MAVDAITLQRPGLSLSRLEVVIIRRVSASESSGRRPLDSRSAGWAVRLGAALARRGVSPNGISAGGLLAAVLAATGFLLAAQVGAAGWLLLAATGIQLRLLCNLMDGMVAVEGGLASATGPLWNELPDRIEDALILVAAGWWLPLTGARELGFLAAMMALLTAYLRQVGGALGQEQDFRGPMAKPHRMAVMTVAALLEAVVSGFDLSLPTGAVLVVGLGIVALGSLVTAVRRTVRMVERLP